jgi:pyruvate/2-oxoglutarate dehydrogenase complex dihydrolipoamide dehydrogenase (E3) component/uncharacterized membrane protein YdjX (TVP38/TMEM64 family)
MKRLILLAIVATLVGLFFAFDLDSYFTIASLNARRDQLLALRAAAPWAFAGSFVAIYVATAALALPGATILTLAAGALFGTVMGTALVSIASASGATLGLLVSRYLLRDLVNRRFGDRLKTIHDGVRKDGAYYLLTLRLIPVFPFFLVNLLMGLTPIRARTFYWVSQVGMFPATLVYVNAGTQLGRIDSLAGIASPAVIGSFVLLALFPWVARGILRVVRQRQVYGRWRRPKAYDRNLIVIGAGAAGLVSTYIAATVRAKVTLVESGKMGGDCLNYGCVPSKALIRSAKLAQQMANAERYGLQATTATFSFRQVMARVHEVIAAIAPHDSVERYTALGAEVLQGYAKLVDPWTVEIALNDGGTRRLTARSIVIAAGASPIVPPLPGIESSGYVTSDTLWEAYARLDAAPRRLLVLGGGPIGCELAQAFARLGSQVTLVQGDTRLLPREDEEVSTFAQAALAADGVAVLTGCRAVRCGQSGDARWLVVEGAGGERRIDYDGLICALGRAARLTGYGLEELGIPVQRTVATNEYLETLYPNIFAAGDVAGPYQFTHVAAHQAWYATVNALFGHLRRFKVDYSVIPWTTFIDPEVARVGLNEQEAREQGIACEVTRFELHELDRAIADSATKGFIKVLTVPGKDRILGVSFVGEHAGDLLAEYVLAMKQKIGLNRILGTIHTYPTLAEANKYVAGNWKRAHAPQRLLAWVGRYHAWRRG